VLKVKCEHFWIPVSSLSITGNKVPTQATPGIGWFAGDIVSGPRGKVLLALSSHGTNLKIKTSIALILSVHDF